MTKFECGKCKKLFDVKKGIIVNTQSMGSSVLLICEGCYKVKDAKPSVLEKLKERW